MASESTFTLRPAVNMGCVVSAIFVAIAFTAEITGRGPESGAHQVAHANPRDFAQAVQVPKAALGYPKEWYRLALPISSACFLASFAIWSLHSVGNRALRPLPIQDQGGV